MGKKILIADDDLDMAKLLLLRLREHKYEAIIAGDGFEAVKKAHRDKPDLIILDIKMPAGGGMTVFENLRKSTDTCSIPVIFITAFPEKETRDNALRMGALDYITKPYDANEVITKIEKALGEGAA